MKKGWEEKSLGSVCLFLSRGVSPKYVERGGIIVLNQRCIRDHRVSFEAARRHDASSKKVSNERLVQVGDVLVNSTGTGTLGRVAQIRDEPPEPTTVDSHVTIVRPVPDLFFREFFGYMMRDIEDGIKEGGEGTSGQTELSRATLSEKFIVRFPKSKADQQRIVGILDDAFEGLATARANAEKSLENARALLASELDDVFSRGKETWQRSTLEHVLCVQPQNGWSPPAAHHTDAGVPVLTLSAVTGFQFRPEKIKFTSASTNPRRHYWVKDGDLLITRSNTPELVGHVAIASGITRPTIYPDLIMRMNPDPSRAKTEFLYYQLRSSSMRKEIMSRAQGANPTMKKISNGAVRTLPVVLPSVGEQEIIGERLQNLEAETDNLAGIYQRKLAALDALKKSILHEAFSGNI